MCSVFISVVIQLLEATIFTSRDGRPAMDRHFIANVTEQGFNHFTVSIYLLYKMMIYYNRSCGGQENISDLFTYILAIG